MAKQRQRSFRFSEELDNKLEKFVSRKGDLTKVVEQALEAHFQLTKAGTIHQTVMEWLVQTRASRRDLDATKLVQIAAIFNQLDRLLTDETATRNLAIRAAAFDSVLSLWRNPEDFVENWRKERQVVKFPYRKTDGGPGDFLAIADFQDAIFKKARSFDDVASLPVASEISDSPGYFDVALRADMNFRPRIFCFGFYQTNERRSHHGLIPYGRHTKLGVLFGKTGWEAFESAHADTARNISGALKQSRESVRSFLIEVIDHVTQNKGSQPSPMIYSLDGFIHDEVIAEIIYRRCEPSIANRFASLSEKIIAPSQDIFSTAVSEKLKKNEHTVFLVDLLYADVFRGKTSKFKLLEIEHHLTIPVGIGFTHTALPRMLEREEPEQITEALCTYLEEENRRETLTSDFLKIGVEFDGNLSCPAPP
jgi:hypothetical protein